MDGCTEADAAPHLGQLAAQLHDVVCKMRFGLGCRNRTTRVTTGGPTSAQLSILFALLRRGPMRITDLAAYECVCTPTASSAVDRLERRGMVKRFGTRSDQRAVLVDLTPHGRADLEAVRGARATVFIELLSDFGDDDLRALHDALGPLNRLVSLANCRQPQPKNVEGAADVASAG